MSDLRTAVAWKLVKAPRDVAVAGCQLVRETTEIDVTQLETLAAAAGVTTVTDPVVDSIAYAGTWLVSNVTSVQNDQRWGGLQQTLTKVNTSLPTPIITEGRDILDVHQTQEGEEYYAFYTYLYLIPTGTNIHTWATMAVSCPLSGYTEKERKVITEDTGDRTATMTIAFRKVTWPNTVPTGVVTSYRGWNGELKMATIRTEQFTGIPQASVATFVVSLRDGVLAPVAPWYLMEASAAYGGRGDATIVRTCRYGHDESSVPVTYSDGLVVEKQLGVLGADTKTITLLWPALTVAETAVLIADIEANHNPLVWGGISYPLHKLQQRRDGDSGLIDLTAIGMAANVVINGKGFPQGTYPFIKGYYWHTDTYDSTNPAQGLYYVYESLMVDSNRLKAQAFAKGPATGDASYEHYQFPAFNHHGVVWSNVIEYDPVADLYTVKRLYFRKETSSTAQPDYYITDDANYDWTP